MKIISPTTSVFIPEGGVIRAPAEGPFTVVDSYADHLLRQGVLTKDQVKDAPATVRAAAK